MNGSKSRAVAAQERLSRLRKYLTLFVWVAGICLSLGAYTFLANALLHDGAGEAHAPVRSLAAPDQEAVMKIDPATKAVAPGATFSVTVMIEDVINLGAFQFDLTYNPDVVIVTNVELGPFLSSSGRNVNEVGPTHGTGIVTYGAFSWGANDGPNGDGVLAIITLQASMSTGTSPLHLQNVTATDTFGSSISTSTEDGEVTVGTGAAPPEVTRVIPNFGYTVEVTKNVIVEGTDFQTDASVQLTRSGQSPLSAPQPDVQSSTRISCTFNLGKAVAGQWDVVVTNPDSQSDTLPNGFTVYSDPAPALSSISPDWGYNNEVVDVTLTGSDFQSGATVKLIKGQAEIVADNPVAVSDSQITCDLDLRGASPGKWTVRVTNPDTQHMDLGNHFTVKMLVYLPLVTRNHS